MDKILNLVKEFIFSSPIIAMAIKLAPRDKVYEVVQRMFTVPEKQWSGLMKFSTKRQNDEWDALRVKLADVLSDIAIMAATHGSMLPDEDTPSTKASSN